MVGITAFHAHVPPYRLNREEFSRAWGTANPGGERAVARYDEDSLTMAVSAALGCVKAGGPRADGLFFASTTSPYREKQAASLIAAAVDLPRQSRTADFTDSLRGATVAVHSAMDAVKGGSAENVIVTASDFRMGEGKSRFESLFGEGAVALAIGKEDVIAEIEWGCSLFTEILDLWRREEDSFTRSWEERFVVSEGYMNTMEKVLTKTMEKSGLAPKDFSRVVFYGPDPRSHKTLARRLGFDLGAQVQDPLFDLVGNTGTAALPMMLVAALDEAEPGDVMLVANYGDGGDAFILKVTEHIRAYRHNHKLKALLKETIPIHYERYLNWRELVPIEVPARPESPPPSITCLWRESKSVLAFYGTRCKHCGTAQYPPQRICIQCRTKDDFEDYKFSDKKGHIFTYTLDYLTPDRESPAVVGVVDFEGGGRVMCEITECEPSRIEIGMPVEMCFRKVGRQGSIHNYSWKARPLSS
ncbi:MAG: hydroxymethylglutaryl-CoA synthase family protein [Deltaproteobacteria bacterium]|nr:hydroxymethylglutaryl-CoA synthase family protein [Deltaproteobacteria bacterium]